MAHSGLGQEMYEMNLEHLSITARVLSDASESCVERTQEPTEVPLAKIEHF